MKKVFGMMILVVALVCAMTVTAGAAVAGDGSVVRTDFGIGRALATAAGPDVPSVPATTEVAPPAGYAGYTVREVAPPEGYIDLGPAIYVDENGNTVTVDENGVETIIEPAPLEPVLAPAIAMDAWGNTWVTDGSGERQMEAGPLSEVILAYDANYDFWAEENRPQASVISGLLCIYNQDGLVLVLDLVNAEVQEDAMVMSFNEDVAVKAVFETAATQTSDVRMNPDEIIVWF